MAIADLEEATEAVNDQPLSSYKKLSRLRRTGSGAAYDIPNDPEDITGGYLIEWDMASRSESYASWYQTTHMRFLGLKSPKYLSRAQYLYITDLLQGFEDALYSKTGYNDEGKYYTDYIDLGSFVRKYMLEEVSKNFDGSRSSQYLYKPSDSVSTKLFAGPAWDYDSAWGAFARNEQKTDTLYPSGFLTSKSRGDGTWWGVLYAHTDFFEEVCRVYEAQYRPALSILLGEEEDPSGVLRSVDAYIEPIHAAIDMNYTRWTFGNRGGAARTGTTFEANIKYLKDFISGRRDFLDKEWLKSGTSAE